MCYPLLIGMAMMAASAAFSAYTQTEQQNQAAMAQRRQEKYEASVSAQNANRARAEADLAKAQSNENLRNMDRQRTQMRREFEAEQGSNLSMLAASGTDIGSGSAFDLLSGNADIFSADMGEALRNREFAKWEGQNKVGGLLHEAEMYDSKANFLRSTKVNLGNSLLNAGIAGAGAIGSGLISYGMSSGGSAPSAPKKTPSNYYPNSTTGQYYTTRGGH